MSRALAIAALLVAACYRPSLEEACTVSCATADCPGDMACVSGLCRPAGTSCAGDADGGLTDAATDDAGQTCYGAGTGTGVYTRICHDPSTASLSLPALVKTSGTDASCSFVHEQAPRVLCVIAAREISVAATVRVEGSRALVLLASETLRVEGTLEVSAGARSCQTPAGMMGGTGLGAGGGAGGSFQFEGGEGGDGHADSVFGGPNKPENVPVVVSGGCDGGAGGAGDDGIAAGGRGGGAVYLMGGTIIVDGTINASGAGGGGGAKLGGGGGGGSGGMILLDGTQIQIGSAARIFALGAGGGGGAGDNSGMPGTAAASPTDPGLGGTATAPGGRGGHASSAGGGDGVDGALNGGGGGGAGAAGYIFVNATDIPINANIAPPPS